MLRCKFTVSSVKKSEDGTSRTLTMNASYGDGGDNKDWSKWTPSGSFTITVTNESAFEKIDAMKYGDLYYIDIAPVPAAAPA